eukprot:TRINITY_DN23909_c0_g1_i1.p1 TRINITY_DN23909_c0_g1~~TRINITY_DN23909_c0_g1_i1.p1  ORF type:complete len:1227 (+),score=139.08 TRINITY_DN23909_c0_g1_i1:46-3726(+)
MPAPTSPPTNGHCYSESDVLIEFDALVRDIDQAFEHIQHRLHSSQNRMNSELHFWHHEEDWEAAAPVSEPNRAATAGRKVCFERPTVLTTDLPDDSKHGTDSHTPKSLFGRSGRKKNRALAPLEVSSALRNRTAQVVHGISEQGKEEFLQELRLHPRIIELANKSSDILDTSMHNRVSSSSSRQSLIDLKELASDNTSAGAGEVVRNRALSRMPLVMHPHSTYRLCWDIVGMFLILVDSFVLPVSLAWDLPMSTDDSAGVFRVASFWTSLLFWSCDIASNFNTGYYAGGMLQLRRSAIAWRYFTTWLIFDTGLMSLDFIQAETLINPTGSGHQLLSSVRILRIFRGLRVLRVLKFSRLYAVIEEASIAAGKQWLVLVVAIFNTTFAMMVCAHLLACFWYFVGRLRSEAGHRSWIDLADASNIPGGVQYLHSFLWVLSPPAPPIVEPDSALERAYCVLILGATVVVIGSALSKITGTLGELRSIKEEQTRKRREARTYLHAQNVPMELTARVMKFVDHKLEHQSSVNLDHTLISPALHVEIHLHQRLQYLMPHPFFALTQSVFPDVFADMCAALAHNVYGKGEVVFAMDQRGQSMYVTCAGLFSLCEGHTQGMQSMEEGSATPTVKMICCDSTTADLLLKRRSHQLTAKIHWFAEESLYAESYVHQSTLQAESFCVAFTLTSENVCKILDSSPSCASMYCEYAKDILKHIKRMMTAREEYDHSDYENCAHNACKDNRVYSEMYPDKKTMLDNIVLPVWVSLFGDNSPTKSNGDSMTPRGVVEELLNTPFSDTSISNKLQAIFPELQEGTGSHALLSQPGERERSESSCLSIVALLTNSYENFTRPQDPKDRLTESQWESLRRIVTWAAPTGSISIHALLVLLSIRSLGKSKRVTQQLGPKFQRPEQALLCLISSHTNVVPSIECLTEGEIDTIRATLMIHQEFNLAQMLQGENAPAGVLQLQVMLRENGQHVFQFYIMFLIGFMSGLAGGRGSKFLNAKTSESVILGISSLLYVLDSTPRTIYWNYMTKRGGQLGLPTSSREDMAFVRLACLARVRDEADLQRLRFSWEVLALSDRQVLEQNFLADGIDENAIVFEFLPDCIANAQRNHHIGLPVLFDVLVDLIMSLESTGGKLPVFPGTSLRVIDLSEMSVFIQAVQNKHIFHTCVSRCRLHIAEGRTYFKMSSANWDRASEVETDATQLAYCMNELLQRQKFVQETVLRLDATGK